MLRGRDGGADFALFTDLYILTMLQAYVREGMAETAVFDFFIRRLPRRWNYVIACGIADVLHFVENAHFSEDALVYLSSLGHFSQEFLDYLAGFRFTGDIYALPEGSIAFPSEPLVEVVAPLPEAQLVETFLINQVHFQSLMASKAARVVRAAAGATVVDFGSRRAHGTDAAIKGARAFHIAGVAATSNVFAGRQYGLPVRGTMAHSYVQAHDDESEALRHFAALYPETVLLVDTYDTLAGVRKVVALAEEMGKDFAVRAIRLDSGDLGALAHAARRVLDDAGLHRVEIFASNSLEEYAIADLVRRGAPIDGYGVGTRMSVSSDAPTLDCAYKLVEYAGKGRMKLSAHKTSLPGRKQVYRQCERGAFARDVIALADEPSAGAPLLVPVMRNGARLPAGRDDVTAARERAHRHREFLPPRLHSLDEAQPPYEVALSEGLSALRDRLGAELAKGAGS